MHLYLCSAYIMTKFQLFFFSLEKQFTNFWWENLIEKWKFDMNCFFFFGRLFEME